MSVVSESDQPLAIEAPSDLANDASTADALNVILPTAAAAAIAQSKTTTNIASDEYHFASVSMPILFSFFIFIFQIFKFYFVKLFVKR